MNATAGGSSCTVSHVFVVFAAAIMSVKRTLFFFLFGLVAGWTSASGGQLPGILQCNGSPMRFDDVGNVQGVKLANLCAQVRHSKQCKMSHVVRAVRHWSKNRTHGHPMQHSQIHFLLDTS